MLKESPPFPYFHSLVDEGVMSPLEYAFAKRYTPDRNENVALFLGYLLKAARQGHLCVSASLELSPPLKRLIDATNIPGDLESRIQRGYEEGVVAFRESDWLYIDEDRVYLKHLYLCEQKVSQALANYLREKPQKEIGEKALESSLQELEQQGLLLAAQGAAIRGARASCLLYLTGGPGTGKTYTAAHLLNLFSKLGGGKVALAAPTGKAAGNLQQAIEKILPESHFEVKTLHALLQLHRKQTRSYLVPIDADLVLVDEASMIDAKVMAELLSSIKPGARLILMGDDAQLPPVEAGSLFADMVRLLRRSSAYSERVAELEQTVRTDRPELLSLFDHVRRGRYDAFSEQLLRESQVVKLESDFSRLPRQASQHLMSEPLAEEEITSQLLQKVDAFCVLLPTRQGRYGVIETNKTLFHQAMRRKETGKFTAIPIMICRNDYTLLLRNGERGLLILDDEEKRLFAMFASSSRTLPFYDEAKGYRQIPHYLLPPYELSYALSIHKSQGSEFQDVVVGLPDGGGEGLFRELLYTALTRAKRSVTIYSTPKQLERAITSSQSRLSGLKLT